MKMAKNEEEKMFEMSYLVSVRHGAHVFDLLMQSR